MAALGVEAETRAKLFFAQVAQGARDQSAAAVAEDVEVVITGSEALVELHHVRRHAGGQRRVVEAVEVLAVAFAQRREEACILRQVAERCRNTAESAMDEQQRTLCWRNLRHARWRIGNEEHFTVEDAQRPVRVLPGAHQRADRRAVRRVRRPSSRAL